VLWELKVAPNDPAECSATCWLGLRLENGRLLVIGLGDGLALIRLPNGEVRSLGRAPGEFLNRTLSLGQAHRLPDWQVLEIERAEPDTIIVLATDGVADDLRSDRLGDWALSLVQDHGGQPAGERRRLRQALQQWPTPGHNDDKTVAVLWQPEDATKGRST